MGNDNLGVNIRISDKYAVLIETEGQIHPLVKVATKFDAESVEFPSDDQIVCGEFLECRVWRYLFRYQVKDCVRREVVQIGIVMRVVVLWLVVYVLLDGFEWQEGVLLGFLFLLLRKCERREVFGIFGDGFSWCMNSRESISLCVGSAIFVLYVEENIVNIQWKNKEKKRLKEERVYCLEVPTKIFFSIIGLFLRTSFYS